MTALACVTAAGADGLDPFALLTGIARTVAYLGFVLVVGTSFFLAWLWPVDATEPTFARLFYSGAALLFVTTPLVTLFSVSGSLGDALVGREGALALARMALVALGVGFAGEILGSPRRWRIPTTLWQVALLETFVLRSDAWGGAWQLVKIVATTGHLAATAAWLGGLLALAAVLIPSSHLEVLHDVLPKFSVIAIVSVVTLTVTGAVHALAVAGSFTALTSSDYGTVLMAKIVLFGVMLVLGNVGRRYAGGLSHRKATEIDESASESSVRAFAVAIGAELALAIAVLAATAALVHVAPAA